MTPSAPEKIVELKAVSKTYPAKTSFFIHKKKAIIALNRISLQIQKGEMFGLVGESGSGKTTAGRLIVKLEEPSAGEVFLRGKSLASLKGTALKDFRAKVQMIFQDPYQSLNPQISIYDTICEPLVIHRRGDAEERGIAVLEALTAVGLSPPEVFLNRFPHQLSGGQRQRVAIARAVILKPTFVVADEPTSMLDASISIHIFNILLELRKKLDTTILFITHSLAAAHYLCNRIAVIYRGNIVESGPAKVVIQNPLHPYTRALMDALPQYAHGGAFKRYGTLLGTPREAPDTVGCPFFSRCKVAHHSLCSRQAPTLDSKNDDQLAACFFA